MGVETGSQFEHCPGNHESQFETTRVWRGEKAAKPLLEPILKGGTLIITTGFNPELDFSYVVIRDPDLPKPLADFNPFEELIYVECQPELSSDSQRVREEHLSDWFDLIESPEYPTFRVDTLYPELYPVEVSWRYFLIPGVLHGRLMDLFHQIGQRLNKLLDKIDPIREAPEQ